MSNTVMFEKIINDFQFNIFFKSLDAIPNYILLTNNYNTFGKHVGSIEAVTSYYYFYKALILKYDLKRFPEVSNIIKSSLSSFSFKCTQVFVMNTQINEVISFFKKHPDAIDLFIDSMERGGNYAFLEKKLEIIRIICDDDYLIRKAECLFYDITNKDYIK